MRIAMIGIKAIPARFGGFETAVDEIARGLVKHRHEVVVYNRAQMSSYSGTDYEGIKLITLPTVRSKNLGTIFHAFLCTLHVMFHRVDIVHFFTTGVSIFAPLARMAAMKTVCSVDGTDWQRRKWTWFARTYLRLSERLAVWFCNELVSDSRAVMNYYREQYGASSHVIAYGLRECGSTGTEWLERFGLHSGEYVLFVGRLVPENNVHHLIRAFADIRTEKKLVIVGDDPWEKDYIRSLKATRDHRVVFAGGVYGEGYEQLQRNAFLFVLPDEVGGTHPALVEAMGFGNCVLVNDTASNLEVIGSAGFSYQGDEGHLDLQRQLQSLLDNPLVVEEYRLKAKERAYQQYRWEKVVSEHEALYRELLGVSRPKTGRVLF
jgi:glycosyltransferase involved in cell wall biosynthesis